MKRPLILAPWLAGLMLGACSSSSDPEPAERNKALTKAVHEPLDQAKALEQQLQEQAEANRKKIDEATQ
ncbi:MAG TPA: hypothetical protein VI457_03325 [Methylococcaceae bacterium]|nr:hypothetical protein [Methylococcaceae bacterium]